MFVEEEQSMRNNMQWSDGCRWPKLAKSGGGI
jgi:hypothetical protein